MRKILSLFLAIILTVTSVQFVFAAPDTYAVEGAALVVLPSDADTDRMFVTDYALYLGDQKLDAKFTIEGDTASLFMARDGHLITSSRAQAGQITVKALYEGRTYTKQVTTVKGEYIDFEGETVGQKPTDWVNRAVEIAAESDGQTTNKYLDTLATYGRYDFPAGNLADKSTTIEWNVRFTLSGTTVKPSSLMALTHNWADAQLSSGSYYYNIYARHSEGKVELYRQNKSDGESVSYPYTAGVLGTVDANEWVNMKLVLNYTDREYSIYVNNELKADKWKFESGITDYATLVGIMPYGYVDNIKVYTGTPGAYAASAPSQNVMLPESGKTTTAELGMNLTVGGTTYENIATSWELKNPYTGVSVSGNVLTVTDEASAGDVVLVPTDNRFNCEKTVTINEPTIYLSTTDSSIKITAEPSTEYKITLYHPKAQTLDLAEKYLEAYDLGDAGAVVTSDGFTTDAQGKFTYSTQSLDAGVYNVYVEPVSDITGEVAHAPLYNRISELLSDSAAMETAGFAQLLVKEGVAEAAEAHNVYKALSNKDYAATLTDGNIQNFSAAAALASILEQSADSAGLRTFAASALEGALYDASALDLLSKNGNYTEVTDAVKTDNCTNITDLLASLKTHSVLKGIKNAASLNDAKDFAASLGISKYDSARESQKDYVAGLLLNNEYNSIGEITDVINGADLGLVEIAYHIEGNSSVALPAKDGTMSAIGYTLIDTELDTPVDARFSISGDDTTGLYITTDGTLITSSKAASGTIKVNAMYEGKTYTKDVSLKLGLYHDFEADTAGQKPAGWVDRDVVVASDASGNNYLNSLDTYARYNFAQDLASESVTVEYEVKYTIADNKLNTANVLAFTHGWTNRAENQGRYYLGMSAALSSDKTQVEFSRGYNQNGVSGSTYLGSALIDEWVRVKHVFNFSDKTYDIHINSTKVAEGWKMDADITEATLVGIIPYGYTDNFNVYSGDAGVFLAFAPAQSAALPRQGKTAEVELGLDLTVNGTLHSGAITNWQLETPYEGVSVEGNVLTVTDSASAGTVYLTAKDGNIDVTKEVTLFEPTILLDIENTDLKITAKANENYNIYIYKNKGGAELVDKFITPTFYGDMTADKEEFLNANAGSSGIITRSLSALDAGIYNIYVRESASEAEVAHVQYISSLSDLFADYSQIASPKFVTFLTNQGIDYQSAAQAQNIYKNLDDKAFVYGLMDGDIEMFPIAASLCKVMQAGSDDAFARGFLSQQLQDKGYDVIALELLRKNAIYQEVSAATISQGLTDVQTVLNNLKTNSILIGIKNTPNKRDAKAFLEQIGSDVYNGATNDEKNTIADAVAKKAYTTINDVKIAVANVDLTQAGEGSGGPGGVSTSGGSASGVGAPAPVVKPPLLTGEYYDVADDFWAKDAIEILSQKGIISGYDGMFRPEDSLSRGEMAKIISVAANLKDGKADFADVTPNDWFYPYVGASFESGLINGYDGKFNPYTNITRQDVAVILYRLFGTKLDQADDMSFADSANVADYARTAVSTLGRAGIINGYEDGTFKPQNSITRAEIAQLMANCITLWEGDSNE